MTATASALQTDQLTSVPMHAIEEELARQLKAVQGEGERPVLLARMSNLVVFCNRADSLEKIQESLLAIVASHPARVLLLVEDASRTAGAITASVGVWAHRLGAAQWVCSERIVLHSPSRAIELLPYAVRRLLVGDLPMNVWWSATQPPPMAGPFLHELAEQAQQVIYDSYGWTEPARAVAATAAWLARFERGPGQGRWRVASDLNWRRLKYWRRLLAQALDPASAPGTTRAIQEVLVEHGPHAVVQAWLLASWLAVRLGWRVQTGKVQPGMEIHWQVAAPSGSLRVRIKRLAEGPSQIRRVRITALIDGKPASLDVTAVDDRMLAAVPEGVQAAPRTLMVQPQSLVELVGRQITDRDRDPVFKESMAVAQVFAQSVLS